MTARIELKNISVYGVDTHARAASLRQFITLRKSMKPVRIPILENISFSAKAGDRIAIIGMNGSGKSSILKVISGNYPVHSGTRMVEGAIVPLIEMGAGFEQEASGRYNIKLSYAYRGKLREYTKEKEEQIIEFAELDEKIDHPLKNYSSGMRARLAFGSAIFQDPDILLLDEIFAAGDAGFIGKSHRMLRDRMDKAAITIMVNHGHNEMMDLCNRFVLMHHGRIVNEGPAQEIIAQYHRDILHLHDQNTVVPLSTQMDEEVARAAGI